MGQIFSNPSIPEKEEEINPPIEEKKAEEIEKAVEELKEIENIHFSLKRVPKSLIELIVSLLKSEDVKNCLKTCKEWNQIFSRDFVWRKLFENKFGIESKNVFLLKLIFFFVFFLIFFFIFFNFFFYFF